MHAKTLIFTKEKPSTETINQIMEPHCEEINDEYNPLGFWDWFQIGGRYSGSISAENGAAKIVGEKSWTNVDTDIKGVDGCYIKDIMQNSKEESDWFSSYAYVDIDGTYNARSAWDGNTFVENDNFEKELQDVIKNEDLFVVVLDCHS